MNGFSLDFQGIILHITTKFQEKRIKNIKNVKNVKKMNITLAHSKKK